MTIDEKHTSDDELIQRIQSGDKKAFEELYRRWFFDLCEFANRYVRRRAICEEVVQDLYLNIWKNRKEWHPKGTIRSYLYKGIRNNAIDYLKHLKVEREYLSERKLNRLQEYEEQIGGDSMLNGVLSEDENKKELAEAIEDAILQLPERRREIFRMSREDGLTYQEIADALDISIKTVETQMGRSLKSLRNLLSDYLL